jgi:hypothetical protein
MEKVKYAPSALPAKIPFASDDPKREFVEQLVDRHFLPETGIAFDKVNYMRAGEDYPGLPASYADRGDYLHALRALSRPGTPFAALVNDYNANLAYLRIRLQGDTDIVASLVINRWHDNVAFLIKEDGRLDPAKDSIDFIPDLIGSYPNYFFDVRLEDLPDFLDLLAHFEPTPEAAERLAKYGINRADERFWATYDWFQQRALTDKPVLGGLFDLNRYYYLAR